jgi:DNA-directed RNA polymerase subunit RPC12/RpoP
MFEISCEKCGGELMVDIKMTMDEYNKDVSYLVDEIGKIMESTVQQYLIYKCLDCDAIYKYTYKDWEKQLRLKIANEVMEMKKIEMFRGEINPYTIKSGEKKYCGQCSGYFGDGYCLVDIINQCTIRKK